MTTTIPQTADRPRQGRRTWHIVAMGVGFGEGSCAADLIWAAHRRGVRTVTWTLPGPYARFLAPMPTDLRILADPSAFLSSVRADASVVVLSCSLTCARLLPMLETWTGPLLTLEATWMPWITESTRHFDRVDRFHVLLPPDVFRAGLDHQGGPFHLSESVLRRTCAQGWRGAPVSSGPREDRVVVYFGQPYQALKESGRSLRPEPLVDAIRLVKDRQPSIKWSWIGSLPQRGPSTLPDYVENIPFLPPGSFGALIGRSALLVCHQNAGAMSLAVTSGTRNLALAKGLVFSRKDGAQWADMEIHAWARAGALDPCHGDADPDFLARRMETLLEEGPREPQPADGMNKVVDEILGMTGEAEPAEALPPELDLHTVNRARRAFLVLGPESTGTRFVTRILLAAGCEGSAEHEQPFDESLEGAGDLVAWRRSVPHGGRWPSIQDLVSRLRTSGYSVEAVVTIRDQGITELSQVRDGHAMDVQHARANLRLSWPLVFGQLDRMSVPWHLAVYESLVRGRREVEFFLSHLGLALKEEITIVDGNVKYFNGQGTLP